MSRKSHAAGAPGGRGVRGGCPPRVLCVGGTDPSGCAGIAADLRAVQALGGHALVAVTAVTVQDTRAVRRVAPVAPGVVRAQIDAALTDAGADAVKVGMLGTAGVARAVAERLEARGAPPVVLDPVLRSTTGGALLDPAGLRVLMRRLLPVASLVTPNLPEAETLLGRPIRGAAGMLDAARALLGLGARAVLLKGGHRGGEALDVFDDGRRVLTLRAARIATRNTRGSGCVLAAAIATHLARGLPLEEAVLLSKAFVHEAIRNSYPLGRGRGPVNPAALLVVPKGRGGR